MNKWTTRDLTEIGIYAAIIVLAIHFIRIPMPSILSATFVHPGNALVILSVLLFGFRNGFLASMTGLFIFDTLAGYITSVPFTLLENAIVLLIVYSLAKYGFKGRLALPQLITIGIVGGTSKVILIFFKYIFRQLIIGSTLGAAVSVSAASMGASITTAVVTAILVPVLYAPLKRLFAKRRRVEYRF